MIRCSLKHGEHPVSPPARHPSLYARTPGTCNPDIDYSKYSEKVNTGGKITKTPHQQKFFQKSLSMLGRETLVHNSCDSATIKVLSTRRRCINVKTREHYRTVRTQQTPGDELYISLLGEMNNSSPACRSESEMSRVCTLL